MPRGPRRKVPPAESSNSNSSINNNSVFLENDNKENGVIKTFTKEDAELARAALLNAVKDNKDTTRSTRPFLNLFGAAGSNSNASITLLKPGLSMREQRRMLLRALQQDSTKKEVARTYFASLQNLVRHVVERQEFIPESAFANDDEEEQDDDQKVTPDARSTEGLQFLYYATLCVKSYFTGLVEQGKQGLVIAEVHEIAVALHDTLDQLETSWGPDAANAHQAIVALCETWWLHNGVNREDLIGQALPAIVGAAMHCNKSDIKRLYSIRSALQVIDFEDADSEAFLSLLMHVASSPACLKTAEGKRFLAHLFSLGSSTMRRKLHYSIRAQIPDNKESILQDYSEVYFTAWKDAPPDERQALETDVLQDLMYAVLHAANPSLVQSLLIVLSKFHDNKQSADVEALMYRMYGPVIWRAMTAANARVRINAVSVFAQVFPLQQAASTTTTKTTANNNNTAVHKGCTALKQLLQDPDPRVRVAASAAVAQILSVFWDVIPSNEIRSLLNRKWMDVLVTARCFYFTNVSVSAICFVTDLVAEHASDATSSAVRIGAVNAIATLLDAPQSHAVLRELLPSLGNLIHDKVEKVRLAVVRMLLRIKGIPKVKYYHIVPNDHLQARLAEEGKNNPTNSVASALTSLMVNSFFPKDPKENIRHALKFLTEDPDSAAVFFANVSKFRSADSVAQLTVQLLRCLHSSVEKHVQQEMKLARTATGKRIRSVEANDDDDDAESSEPPPAYVMAYLAETISTLWQSIEAELPRYAEWNKFLLDEFSGPKLTTILTYFEKKAMNGCPSGDDDEIEIFHDDCSRTCSAILRCAGRLPSTAVQDLVPYISSILASVQDSDGGDIPMENVTAHIALLCLWDLTDEVAQSLSMSIRSAFQEDTLFNSPAADTRKRSSRRPRTSDVALAVPQLPPLVALNVLGGILCGAEPSSVGAREAILSSKTACIAIENALKEGKRHAEFVLEGDSVSLLAHAINSTKLFLTWPLLPELSLSEMPTPNTCSVSSRLSVALPFTKRLLKMAVSHSVIKQNCYFTGQRPRSYPRSTVRRARIVLLFPSSTPIYRLFRSRRVLTHSLRPLIRVVDQDDA